MKKKCLYLTVLFCFFIFNIRAKTFIKGVSLNYENDSVLTDTDRYYTNGVQLDILTKNFYDKNEYNFLTKLFNIKNKEYHSFSFGFGQKMFTYHDIKIKEFLKNDRPYAGYLYFFGNKIIKHDNKLDLFGISVGAVGSISLAEQTQKKVHNLIGSPKPSGWNNQLKNELLLSTVFSRIFLTKNSFSTFDYDFFPKITLTVGTPITSLTSSVEFRYGWNLEKDYFSNKIEFNRFSMEKDNFLGQSLYLFTSAELSCIFYNTFLDGNIHNNIETDIRRNIILYELATGLTYRIGNYYFKTSARYMSKEFKEQIKEQVIFLFNFVKLIN